MTMFLAYTLTQSGEYLSIFTSQRLPVWDAHLTPNHVPLCDMLWHQIQNELILSIIFIIIYTYTNFR